MRVFFLLTYLVVLVFHAGCLTDVSYRGAIAPLFAAAAYIVYSLLYLTPAIVIVVGLQFLLRILKRRRRETASPASIRATVAATAVLLTAAIHMLLYADRFIFELYGFHLNGFVWNLVFARGGLDSLGGSRNTTFTFSLIMLGFVVLQTILYLLAAKFAPLRRAERAVVRRRWVALSIMIVLAVSAQVTYGLSYLRGYTPVLMASNTLPLFFPISFNRLARSLGAKAEESRFVQLDDVPTHLSYPRTPLRRDPSAKLYNIVWLVSESLRADMLDPEIMPNSWSFAQRSLWLKNHYSGGNGTRMGIFTLFYGLYGHYWFSFLDERRGPVFFDILLESDYQMSFFTGAGFSYPEFDKTVFVRIDPTKLYENGAIPTYKRDEENVSNVVKFIDTRDAARPFFSYIFFESPHADYHFPASAVIRTAYDHDFNYATMDVSRDMPQMKNRYINACHYLDSQIGRMLDALRDRGLLDSTIVLLTGDHGEEFMEKGRWGHNSSFSQEQIRTPGVLWIPSRAPRALEDMTCHLDFVPTVLRFLGVTNPTQDYCQGRDLLTAGRHDYLILADWNNVAYIDPACKIILPWKAFGFAQQRVTTLDDSEVDDPNGFFASRQDRMVSIMQGLKQFRK